MAKQYITILPFYQFLRSAIDWITYTLQMNINECVEYFLSY